MSSTYTPTMVFSELSAGSFPSMRLPAMNSASASAVGTYMRRPSSTALPSESTSALVSPEPDIRAPKTDDAAAAK